MTENCRDIDGYESSIIIRSPIKATFAISLDRRRSLWGY
jgi:hypothetical protein